VLRVLALVAAALAIALATAGSAAACSCIGEKPRDLLKQSDAAVTARLLEVRPVGGGEPSSSADPTDFVYRIGRVVKGKARLTSGETLVVRSRYSGSSCGLSNFGGKVRGLFLTRENGRWRSWACREVPARQMRRLAAGGAVGSLASC
jgi:hypothetical protein